MKEGCDLFEKERVKDAALRRKLRKGDDSVPENVKIWKCEICGRVLLSKAGYVNHVKSHSGSQNQAAYENIISSRPPENICAVCNKVCKSVSGLKRHMAVHKKDIQQKSLVTTVKTSFVCHVCYKTCKSTAGLKSHLRGHARKKDHGSDVGGLKDNETAII